MFTLALDNATLSLEDSMLGILSVIGLSDEAIGSVRLFEDGIVYTGLEEDMINDISILEFKGVSINMDDADGETISPELFDKTEEDE